MGRRKRPGHCEDDRITYVRGLRTSLTSMSPSQNLGVIPVAVFAIFPQSSTLSNMSFSAIAAALPFSRTLRCGRISSHALVAIRHDQNVVTTVPLDESPLRTRWLPYQNPWTNIDVKTNLTRPIWNPLFRACFR